MFFIFIVIFGMGCQPRSAITQLSMEKAEGRFFPLKSVFSASAPYSFREVAAFEQYVYPYVDEQGVAIEGNALAELSPEQLEDAFVRAWPFYDPIDLIKNASDTFYENFINGEDEPILNQQDFDLDTLRSMVEVGLQEIDAPFVLPAEASKIALPEGHPLNAFFPEFPFWESLLSMGEKGEALETISDSDWYVSDVVLWENRHYVGEWSALQMIQDSTNSWPQFFVFTEKESVSEDASPSEDVFSELQFVLAYDEQGHLQQLLAFDRDGEQPLFNQSLLVFMNFLYDEKGNLVKINAWNVAYESDQLQVSRMGYQTHCYLHN